MKKIVLALAICLVSAGPAFATCKSDAADKKLAGAAKTSFLKKCKRESCLVKAVGSNGRPLAGAAKKSFMQKCAKEA